jgi:hypothetical protein
MQYAERALSLPPDPNVTAGPAHVHVLPSESLNVGVVPGVYQ